MIAIYTHEDCLEHDTGLGHPENSGRLSSILNVLKSCEFADYLSFIDAPLGRKEDIVLAHTQRYFDEIKKHQPEEGLSYLDSDTVVSPGSFNAALRAVGAGCSALDDIEKPDYCTPFCAVRPPGHHATKDKAMGFCLFNSIAITALYALEIKNYERVAIVDFDVHHGNGTQDIVQDDPRIFYISTHQSPFYPGTGAAEENGVGNILNLPLPHGTDSKTYREVFSAEVLSALENFKPELLLVSAGFDAHEDDPLAGLRLTEEDYGWIGGQLFDFTKEYCDGRMISFLEGGYNHQALSASVKAYLKVFVFV